MRGVPRVRTANGLSLGYTDSGVGRATPIVFLHGVGSDKACAMPLMFSSADLEAMKRLRAAFDPAGLANPGKLFPTPRLCGEVPGPHRAHPLELAGLAERF